MPTAQSLSSVGEERQVGRLLLTCNALNLAACAQTRGSAELVTADVARESAP